MMRVPFPESEAEVHQQPRGQGQITSRHGEFRILKDKVDPVQDFAPAELVAVPPAGKWKYPASATTARL
jgi:hypothetical protein